MPTPRPAKGEPARRGASPVAKLHTLEHFPQKWVRFCGQKMLQVFELEPFLSDLIDSIRSDRALAVSASDERGVSAIEFALVAPMLILMFMGLCDLCSAVMTQLHVDRASQGTGEVVAAEPALQTTDMVNMFTAAGQFMQPYSATPLDIRISSIYLAQDLTTKVYWSCSSNASTLPTLAANAAVSTTPTSVPVQFILDKSNPAGVNSSYIMVEARYTFSSPSNYIIKTSSVMTSTAFLQPRVGLYVGFPWSGTGGYPTAPNSTTTSSSLTLTNGATCNYRS